MTTTKRAFTLIELIIVVAIIAVLAAVIVVSLNGERTKSRNARRIADLKTIQTAVETYANENGVYPVRRDGDVIPIENLKSLPSVPTPPEGASGNYCTNESVYFDKYFYRSDASQTDYKLYVIPEKVGNQCPDEARQDGGQYDWMYELFTPEGRTMS